MNSDATALQDQEKSSFVEIPIIVKSPYQIVSYVCEECQTMKVKTPSGLVEASREFHDMASCDSRKVEIKADGKISNNLSTVTEALRLIIFIKDRGKCRTPGCNHTLFRDRSGRILQEL